MNNPLADAGSEDADKADQQSGCKCPVDDFAHIKYGFIVQHTFSLFARTGCLPIAMQKYGLWPEYMPLQGFFGPTCCDTPPRLRQTGRMPPEIVATTFPMRPENGY